GSGSPRSASRSRRRACSSPATGPATRWTSTPPGSRRRSRPTGSGSWPASAASPTCSTVTARCSTRARWRRSATGSPRRPRPAATTRGSSSRRRPRDTSTSTTPTRPSTPCGCGRPTRSPPPATTASTSSTRRTGRCRRSRRFRTPRRSSTPSTTCGATTPNRCAPSTAGRDGCSTSRSSTTRRWSRTRSTTRPSRSPVRGGRDVPDMTPGVPSALSPLVRRIVAPNPGPFTGPGTNTYLVGIDEVAVIDPGLDDQGHIDAIVGASMRERVRWVLLTHTHPDHSPGTARLVAQTGAEVLAFTKRSGDKDGGEIVVDRTIGEGDSIEGTEFGLEVLHTPGHAPNHLCFLLEEERVLFTGDTVLEGMYSVVNPSRGGDMAVYVKTLERLRKLRLSRIAPGHGDVIEEPRARLDDYIAHRKQREQQVLRLLKKRGTAKVKEIVEDIYGSDDLPKELVEAAGWQVHAHLVKLKADGKVTGT